MGYYMTVREPYLRIDKEHLPSVLKALKKLTKEKGESAAWVNADSAMAKIRDNDLEGAMRVWRWQPFFNGNGDIVGFAFVGEKLGHDIDFFEAIAPWVASESYIEMVGEDNTIWRWLFRDQMVKEELATIVYP